MCLGANLGDAVVLAADGRPLVRRRRHPLADRLLQAVLAERQPANVVAYLQTLQPFAQETLEAHADLYDRPAGACRLHRRHRHVRAARWGFDPDSRGMSLFGFAPGDRFETRLW